MNKKVKIVVIGASGVLGELICSELNHLFENSIKLFVGDYHTKRGKITADKFNAEFCETNTDNIDKLSTSLSGKDIAVVTINKIEPVIQKICLEKSILCIDVTVFYSFAKKVQDLYSCNTDLKSTSVLMAGFIPGLSGLLLKKAINDFDEINESNITLLQNTNAKAGASGIIDMLKIISEPVSTIFDNKNIDLSGFSLKREIRIPRSDINYKVRLISHSEKHLLLEKLHIKNLNYWTAWNSSFFNILVSFIRSTGLINFVTKKIKKEAMKKMIKHDENKSEETVLIADVKGYKGKLEQSKYLVIKSFSDYGTTAKITAALAEIILHKKTEGVCFPFEITTIDEMLDIMNDKRIKYHEY